MLKISIFLIILFSSDLFSDEQFSKWYFEIGSGWSDLSLSSYEGSNHDPTCYPIYLCYSDNPNKDVFGYIWKFSLYPEIGSLYHFSLGKSFGDVRYEISSYEIVNSLSQEFVAQTDLGGRDHLYREDSHSIVSNDLNLIGDSHTRLFTFNIYKDFKSSWSFIDPFIGAGSGLALLTVRSLHYSNNYQDLSGVNESLQLLRFNVVTDSDYFGILYPVIFHIGLNISFYNSIDMGIKASHIMLNEISDEANYISHPMFDDSRSYFANTIKFDYNNVNLISFFVRYTIGT